MSNFLTFLEFESGISRSMNFRIFRFALPPLEFAFPDGNFRKKENSRNKSSEPAKPRPINPYTEDRLFVVGREYEFRNVHMIFRVSLDAKQLNRKENFYVIWRPPTSTFLALCLALHIYKPSITS